MNRIFIVLVLIVCPSVIASTAEFALETMDLVAQQDMARWAKMSFFVILGGLLLSGVSLVALLASLRHTRAAAKAAENAVTLARDTFAIETRAWVSPCFTIRWSQVKDNNGELGIVFSPVCLAKNYGASPATNVSLHTIFTKGILLNTDNDDFCDKARSWANGVNPTAEVIFPQESKILSGNYLYLSYKEIEDYKHSNSSDLVPLALSGCINYHSAHITGVRQTRFKYQFYPQEELMCRPQPTLGLAAGGDAPTAAAGEIVLEGTGRLLAD